MTALDIVLAILATPTVVFLAAWALGYIELNKEWGS
jgi:hypothetical protein